MQHLTGVLPSSRVLFCRRFHYHTSGTHTRYPPGRDSQNRTKGPQYHFRGRKINRRTSYCRKDKMVSNGLQMGPQREMVTVIQGIYTYTPTTRRRKGNRKTNPQESIQNISSIYITGWIIQITDKTNSPNNIIVGR